MDGKASPPNMEKITVWDPIVRIGHWILVIAFTIAYLTEGEPEWLHTWAGYSIATVVVIRVLWGFVGPKHARFSDFVTGPSAVFAYLRGLIARKSRRYIGHSPAGGAMTVAILVMLAVTTFSGMANFAAKDGEGPLAGIISQTPTNRERHSSEDRNNGAERKREDDFWEEIHEVSANLTLVLILFHLGGVALASFVHKENLPRSMVTGKKRP
ncbi:cytochrome b/b6 domain-containing protein [Hoeflea sp. WL0058]|uniref:Cytochrome b/b6 domain-containing protein n=1 Tax=Flavimaribacter sediminis TaxID=2865987 RepID=A0AAE2ZTL2_9HYPH|nr:cytochrome b/b6 domain-containing protein [Flavimaribacter sediminis]MBW8640345.1 cytochrome b/b6 domain-containing protein [Flavimaribacter sediminis]